MSVRRCLDCNSQLLADSHFNQKRCEPCALILRMRPKGTMTTAQIKKATSMAGKVPRKEIAEKLGVSLVNLKRSCPGIMLS